MEKNIENDIDGKFESLCYEYDINGRAKDRLREAMNETIRITDFYKSKKYEPELSYVAESLNILHTLSKNRGVKLVCSTNKSVKVPISNKELKDDICAGIGRGLRSRPFVKAIIGKPKSDALTKSEVKKLDTYVDAVQRGIKTNIGNSNGYIPMIGMSIQVYYMYCEQIFGSRFVKEIWKKALCDENLYDNEANSIFKDYDIEGMSWSRGRLLLWKLLKISGVLTKVYTHKQVKIWEESLDDHGREDKVYHWVEELLKRGETTNVNALIYLFKSSE